MADFDWGSLFGNLANTALAGYANNRNNEAINQTGRTAAGMAQYHPDAYTDPYGSVTGKPNAAGGVDYSSTMSPQQTALRNLFSGMTQYAGGNLTSNPNDPNATKFNAAAGGFLNQATGFNPSTYAKTQYDLMSSLAAPGDTSDTQNMFDKLQATGRLGLSQNGELGDLGGLALAQQTANNGRMLNAYQLANARQGQLTDMANSTAGTGNNYQNTYFKNLMDMFNGASTAGNNQENTFLDRTKLSGDLSGMASQAGANAGRFVDAAGNAVNANNGSFMGNVLNQVAGPAVSGLVKAGVNKLFGNMAAPAASAATLAPASAALAPVSADLSAAAAAPAFPASTFAAADAAPAAAAVTGAVPAATALTSASPAYQAAMSQALNADLGSTAAAAPAAATPAASGLGTTLGSAAGYAVIAAAAANMIGAMTGRGDAAGFNGPLPDGVTRTKTDGGQGAVSVGNMKFGLGSMGKEGGSMNWFVKGPDGKDKWIGADATNILTRYATTGSLANAGQGQKNQKGFNAEPGTLQDMNPSLYTNQKMLGYYNSLGGQKAFGASFQDWLGQLRKVGQGLSFYAGGEGNIF